ncbi:hypothetical protein CPB86DRAFT_577131 [Serendipita vermifera]|nr:hypothetical protein CPB86DRAFT_577131 [Serendipita vermifera]
MSAENVGQQPKRFKHQSYRAQIKDVHLPSPLAQTAVDDTISGNESHFKNALEQWRQLNLAPAFLQFANYAGHLSGSLPLLLHNWDGIVDYWVDAMAETDLESKQPLLDLLQKLLHDLRKTLSPKYEVILGSLLLQATRSLPPATLETYVQSLSLLFKFILPSVPESTEATWTNLAATMRKCRPEMRRMLAEVWGVTIRRFKPEQKLKATEWMVESLDTVADAVAWVYISSFQSTAPTLHTSTIPLLELLWDRSMVCKDFESASQLMRRVLTATMHYCTIETCAPLANFIVDRIKAIKSGSESLEICHRCLQMSSTVLAYRKGSKAQSVLNGDQLAGVMLALSTISLDDAVKLDVVTCVVACLKSAEMALWARGRTALEHLWKDPLCGYWMAAALSKLDQSKGANWKVFVLPSLQRAIVHNYEKHPSATLKILHLLTRENRLSFDDSEWKSQLEKFCSKRLDDWKNEVLTNPSRWNVKEESVMHLYYILTLLTYLPNAINSVISVVDALLSLNLDAHQVYQDSAVNPAWCLGACFKALSQCKGWNKGADIDTWFNKCISGHSWNPSVLEGLASLSQFCNQPMEFTSAFRALIPALTSHVNSLRRNSLQILASKAINRDSGEDAAVNICLQAESVELSSARTPERVLKTTRIGTLTPVGQSAEIVEICVRWLIAQFKVNLMPVWKASTQALINLINRCGEDIWPIFRAEMQGLFDEASSFDKAPIWAVETNEEYPYQEGEKTWRNPGLQETYSALELVKANKDTSSLIKDQLVEERFDRENYEKQLLKTLEGCAQYAERHNRDLIPLFLSFASPEHGARTSHHKLSSWLTLLAKFNNPKAVYSAASLHSLYNSLLSHPDRVLQRLAMDCIFSYKNKAVTDHEDTIRGLLDDTTWKDHLTSLDLANGMQTPERSEYVELLIRLFYGMMRERRGRNKPQDRRATLLSTLRQCQDEELATLVDLMLQPFQLIDPPSSEPISVVSPMPPSITGKQQVGFLILLTDVNKLLGTKLVSYWPRFLQAIIMIVGNAQKDIQQAKIDEGAMQDDEESSEDGVVPEEGDSHVPLKIARNLRQLGTRRLTDFFRLPVDFNFDPYLPIAFISFISPRVQTLELENTQSPSALLELFHTWSSNPSQMRILVDYDPMVLSKIYACLVSPSVKPIVISRILDIVDNIFATPDAALISRLVRPHISLLITNLTTLIKETSRAGTMTSHLAQRQIGILRAICDHVTEEEQAASLIDLLIPSLRKSSKVVPESVKIDLLQAICRLLHLLDIRKGRTVALTSQIFEAASQLLQTLRVRQARLAAVDVFISLASKDPNIARVAPLIKDLNSFDPHRPEEPDFDRRITAFGLLNEDMFDKLSSSEWLPLLHNMLHFIHDREELSIRANASYAIRRFIETLKSDSSSDRQRLFSKVLFTGLKNGLRTKHELVRTEIVGIIGFAVKECPQNPVLYDMVPLLAKGDEEANFFNNIDHIQNHRRTRALRRLAEQCGSGVLRSSTLNDVFIPMISHFIEDTAADHLLVNEAINTLASIAQSLIWSRYYALVRQYMKGMKEKNGSEKPRIRALIAVLGSFHFAMEETVPVIAEDNDEDNEEIREEQPDQSSSNNVKIADAVNNHLLPSLLRFMEAREETEDVMRLSVTMGVVQVAMHLPEEKQRPQVTRIITILSQALKSKSSETRDAARDTLCKLSVAVGPSYLVDIVRELRIALTRGPQLHVLAVTCHSLLHHLTTAESSKSGPISFDEVASSMSEIASEVIFGQSSKELMSEESKTTMREVRGASSKGLDSMTILSRSVSPSSISHILTPIKSIMYETESTKVMSLVDETLRRISSGLNSNTSLDPAALLSLCHSLISQNAKFLNEKPAQARKEKGRNAFTVQTKRDLPQALNHYAHNSYRFVVLGLDLFVVAFRRNRFDFKDQDIISRLEPMLSVIGNTLYSTATEVIVLGLKAAAAILRAPLGSTPRSLPVIIHQQVEIVRQSGSTESEVAQASLKSLATVLRDCTGAQLKEGDLKFLLQTMEPDLEEVERQAAVFSLLRSIVTRKLVVPEIYDMMDKVANVMVTSQSSQVQETCRNILLQFLLDYPQGKGRLRKQMTFLASNLSYIFESGRLSVMEILTAMFTKFAPELLEEYAQLFFASLVMVLANDDSAECRKKAASLIRNLYQAVGKEPRSQMLERLHIWASQTFPSHLASVAAQVYGLVLDSSSQDIQDRLPIVIQDLRGMIERAIQQQELQGSSPDMMDLDLDWQSPYHALTVLTKLTKLNFDTIDPMDVKEMVFPEHVVRLMLFPHAWVRMAASRHIGTLYSLDKQNKGFDSALSEYHPASLRGMIVVAQNSAIQLRSENMDQQWALQIVKNLVYLGKTFYRYRESTEASELENANWSEDESDTEPNEDAGPNKVKHIAKAPLPWMFSRLSYQVKSAHIERRSSFSTSKPWHLEPAAIFQWFAAMTTHMDAVDVEKYLIHILTPVYRISEDDTTQGVEMGEWIGKVNLTSTLTP